MRGQPSSNVFQSGNWWAWAALIIAGLVAILLLLGAVFGMTLWDALLLRDKEFDPLVEVDVAGDVINVAPADVSCPAPIINLSCPCGGNGTGPEEICVRWMYAVPFVCGLTEQIVNETTRVVVAEHSFSMTVLNPHDANVTFDKRVSMTYPPGQQLPGDVFVSLPADTLTAYEALEMACLEIRALIAPVKRDIGPLIKGYVSVSTPQELFVWGIHSTARSSELGPLLPLIRGAPVSRQEFGLVSTDAIAFDKELAAGLCIEKAFQGPVIM